ncbi:hypothetical protein SteCoe_30216 [Stentor coeruleus]|uniref:Uncharacterized protein n=1 Tax=Stentor coeruleus TaxID=5963 RepID=A0A1R2B413_9CILI|nr:hypothetical protein SteCoe_30216 [Stentor coeruleus]
MDDPFLLKQQIEFLQLELEDAKCHEVQMKSIYESMLKSFTSPSESSSAAEELKILKENHSQELRILENKNRQALQACERKIEDIIHANSILEDNQKRIQARNEETQNQLKFEILKLQEEKSRLEIKLKEKENNENIIEKLNKEITKLKNAMDQQKFHADEELMLLRENCNKNLEDLRRIYDSEKVGLQKLIDDQYAKITKLSQGYLSEELEDMFSSTGNKLDELQNSQSLAIEACKSLKGYLANPESYNLETMAQYSAFIKIIKNLEKNQRELKDAVRVKDGHIQGLTRQEVVLNEIIMDRDGEILKLKKIVGDLRVEAEGTSKPPVHTPKSKHGRSRTAFQPTENSPGIQNREIDTQECEQKSRKSEKNSPGMVECDVCKYYICTSKLVEHVVSCKMEYELRSPSNFSNISAYDQRFSIEKNENLEKQVNELKLSLGKLKNQRDRARVAGEHLLLHLKNVKLQLAVSEERACELQLELKQEIKVLIKKILMIRCKYPLPFDAISEIDRMVNKASRFFGGKMHFNDDE